MNNQQDLTNSEPIVVLIDYGATLWRRDTDDSIVLLNKDGTPLGYWS